MRIPKKTTTTTRGQLTQNTTRNNASENFWTRSRKFFERLSQPVALTFCRRCCYAISAISIQVKRKKKRLTSAKFSLHVLKAPCLCRSVLWQFCVVCYECLVVCDDVYSSCIPVQDIALEGKKGTEKVDGGRGGRLHRRRGRAWMLATGSG